MSTKVAVVMPVYRELDELEKISLTQCRKVLGRYPIIFVAPVGKKFSFVEAGDTVAEFPAENFQSTKTYSRLMLSPQFYATFADFDYILIYQTDAFVFYNALEDFCSLGYDYIGAPWSYLAKVGGKFLRVGNGGFSLRKVKSCRKLLSERGDIVERFADLNEDAILSYCGSRDDCNFRVAPIDVAYKFSMEHSPERCIRKNGGELPFGCHAWYNTAEAFYVKNFLAPILNLPLTDNVPTTGEPKLTQWLRVIALERFSRRLSNGRPMSRYLPTKNFASVQVVRSPAALKILSLLSAEDNFSANDIFIRDAQVDWLRDVTVEKLPHLIISADYDATLIDALERGGLHYGRDFISFQREYLKSCEEIFHGLGR